MTPRFRGYRVDLPGLNQLAAAALDDSRGADDPIQAEALDTIEQLRVSGALVAFAALREHAALAGVDETWQRWFAAAQRALDRARPLAAGLDLDAELNDGELTTLLLQCAVSPAAAADTAVLARASVGRAARRIPWMAELLRPESRHDRPARDALVILLAPLAFDPDAGRTWPGRHRQPGMRGEPAGMAATAGAPAPALPDREPLPELVPLPTPGALPSPSAVPPLIPAPPASAVPVLHPLPASHTLPAPGALPVPDPLPVPAALPVPDRLPPPRNHPPRPRSRS